jgi:hypothetical protein
MSKQYDYLKAYDFIVTNKDKIKEASLGFLEDWFWTAKTIYDEKEFDLDFLDIIYDLRNLDKRIDDCKPSISGCHSSYWATPVLNVVYYDESIINYNCYLGDSTADYPNHSILGCLSKPVQRYISTISLVDM